MSELAIFGGEPIRKRKWPSWPSSDEQLEQRVVEVLRAGRWTVSGFATGRRTEESRFAEDFAAYNGVRFCIPCASGTSALMCAMQALGVGAGDEVIVPGLTWVACASAVAAINAVPVLTDINPENLCLDPAAVRARITHRTRAIMIVHLYAGIADMEQFLQISRETGIPLIEDCAQAHGAIWRGRRVGSLGAVGTFSMQQGKVLTCGEGGACITNDEILADRIYRLRTDGRRLGNTPGTPGCMELVEAGQVFGQNYCMSEIHAAMLQTRLSRLEQENQLRAERAGQLRKRLEEIGNFRFQISSPGTNRATIYHFPIRCAESAFFGADLDLVARALSAELGFWIHRTYAPLDNHTLYDPYSSERFRGVAHLPKLKRAPGNLPNAAAVHETTLVIHHPVFLGSEADMEDIALAFERATQNAHRLKNAQKFPK